MTDALVTQQSIEQWAAPSPAAQATQVAIEMWGTVVSGARLALLTQIALEEWAIVPRIVTGGQTAVSINTG